MKKNFMERHKKLMDKLDKLMIKIKKDTKELDKLLRKVR